MTVLILAAAVVFAIIANVIVYTLVTGPLDQTLLMPEQFPPPELSPLDVESVVLFSTLLGIGAVVVYAIILARSARPLRTFTVIATMVLVASFVLPAAIPSPPVEWSAKLVLMAMHVIGYAVILGTIWVGHQRGWLTSPSPAREGVGQGEAPG